MDQRLFSNSKSSQIIKKNYDDALILVSVFYTCNILMEQLRYLMEKNNEISLVSDHQSETLLEKLKVFRIFCIALISVRVHFISGF